MHARTGRVRQEVEIVTICNVLARDNFKREPREVSHGADAIVGVRDKLLISMAVRRRAYPTKFLPAGGRERPADAGSHVM
jgi:hypothetical protein